MSKFDYTLGAYIHPSKFIFSSVWLFNQTEPSGRDRYFSLSETNYDSAICESTAANSCKVKGIFVVFVL